MDSAFRIATRMVMLYEGKFIADGTPEEFRHSVQPRWSRNSSKAARKGRSSTTPSITHSRSVRGQSALPAARRAASIPSHEIRAQRNLHRPAGDRHAWACSSGVILLLAAPGIFKPLARLPDFFRQRRRPEARRAGAGGGPPDRAGGVHRSAGARRPSRPAKYPEDEVLITVRHRQRRHRLPQRHAAHACKTGCWASRSSISSAARRNPGDAESGYTFVGERVPDLNSALPKMLAVIEPVASTATLTLSELRKTIDSAQRRLRPGGRPARRADQAAPDRRQSQRR